MHEDGVFNFCKELVNIFSCFGRGVHVIEHVMLDPRLNIFCTEELSVSFVRNYNDDGIVSRRSFHHNVLMPLFQIMIQHAVGDIVHQHEHMTAHEIRTRDSQKTLLSTRVPNGHAHIIDGRRNEIDGYRGHVLGNIPVFVKVSLNNGRLAPANGTDKYDIKAHLHLFRAI